MWPLRLKENIMLIHKCIKQLYEMHIYSTSAHMILKHGEDQQIWNQ